MADRTPSSAPLFTNLQDLSAELSEDTGSDLILRKPGANQLIDSPRRDDQSLLGPRGNRVQAGALDRINSTSPLGSPNKANPAGAQKN